MGARMGRINKEIEEIKKFRKKYNEIHADEYDNEWWNDQNAIEEFEGFRNLVKIKPGEVVLDIATGTGTFLIEMAKMGAICYGLDQSPKMLENLKIKVKKYKIKINVEKVNIGTADKLPYHNEIFNWIVCIGMFEYYPLDYIEVLLSEIVTALKREGHCFIDIANPHDSYAQERDYIFSYDLEEFEKIVNSLGLKILTRNSAGYMSQYLCKKDIL
jgi:ubiquinone/menaquinone biosynthesis C-methylase UbiE